MQHDKEEFLVYSIYFSSPFVLTQIFYYYRNYKNQIDKSSLSVHEHQKSNCKLVQNGFDPYWILDHLLVLAIVEIFDDIENRQ